MVELPGVAGELELAGGRAGLGAGAEGALVEGGVAGGATSSFLLQAVSATAATEAIIRVLLIICRTPFDNLWPSRRDARCRLQETPNMIRVEIKEVASQQKQTNFTIV